MRRFTMNPTAAGAVMAPEGVVRVRASYLAPRWVQAPIADRREADT